MEEGCAPLDPMRKSIDEAQNLCRGVEAVAPGPVITKATGASGLEVDGGAWVHEHYLHIHTRNPFSHGVAKEEGKSRATGRLHDGRSR